MNRTEIVNKVKIKMNEISPFDSSGDIVNNTFVDDLLNESTRTILLSAPKKILPITKDDTTTSSDNGDGTGTITLPSNYLRFVELKMKQWKRSVTKLISVDSREYKKQFNKYTRGGTAKPKVAELGDELEYFSVKDDHSIDYFKYVKNEVPENLSNQNLLDAITWQCAGDCFIVLSEIEIAKTAFQKAAEHLK